MLFGGLAMVHTERVLQVVGGCHVHGSLGKDT